MLGFVLWALCGFFFIIFGIYTRNAKKAVGFWANAELFPIENVKEYNRAMEKLWYIYGTIFILLGLPLLDGQNSPLIFLSVVGVMIETITVMAVYILVIEKKFRKK